jgi:predicted Zn finger-like uncharacterized protein
MKIRCPKCRNVIPLGIEQLPDTGLEVKCDNCSARFRLKSKEGKQSTAAKSKPSTTPPINSDPPPVPENIGIQPAPPFPGLDDDDSFAPDAAVAQPALQQDVASLGSLGQEEGPDPFISELDDLFSSVTHSHAHTDPPDTRSKPDLSMPPHELVLDDFFSPTLETPIDPMPAPFAQEQPDWEHAGSGAAIDGLDDLFQELDALNAESSQAQQKTYYVRGQKGNIFGPFPVEIIAGMLKTGQLTGVEEISPDNDFWSPMGDWPEFREAVLSLSSKETEAAEQATAANKKKPLSEQQPPDLLDFSSPQAPSEDEDDVSWEETPLAKTPETAAATGAEQKLPPLPSSEPEIPTITRQASRRIRSALRDDVAESGVFSGTFSLEQVKKISFAPENRKWLLLGGVGFTLLIASIVALVAIIRAPKTKTYRSVQISLTRSFALDLYEDYNHQLLPRITKELMAEPDHPQLLYYRALVLAMLAENYHTTPNVMAKLQKAMDELPRPDDTQKKHRPTFLEMWARGMYALATKKGRDAQNWAAQMAKAEPTEPAHLYIEAKALQLLALDAQALTAYDKALKAMNTPARINYAKGQLFLKQKKWIEAFDAFYQTTLLNPNHYPSYLELVKLENEVPSYQARYEKIWQQTEKVISKIKQSNLSAQFLYFRAMRDQRQNDHHEALRWLLRALQEQPSNTQFQQKLPSFYLATYNYEGTINFLEKMLKLPGKIEPEMAWTFLQVLFRVHRSQDASARFSTLMDRCATCNKSYNFLLWRARVEEAMQLHQHAAQSIDEGLAIKPDSVALLAMKVRVLIKANHKELAKQALEKVEKLEPQDLFDRINKAETFLMLERYEDALKAIEPVFSKYPKDEYLNRIGGLIYKKLKQPERAEQHFSKALEVWAHDLDSIRAMAQVIDLQQKYAQAIPYVLKIIEAYPREHLPYMQAGRLYYFTKQYELAQQRLIQALDIDNRLPEAHFYLASTYEDNKHPDVKRIQEHYEQAHRLAPKERKYLYRLARFYYKQQNIKESLRLYSKLLRATDLSKQQQADILYERSKLLLEMQQWQPALNDLNKILRLQPERTELIRMIADCYRELGRSTQAIVWYRKAIAHYLKNKPRSMDPALISPEETKWKKDLGEMYSKIGDLYRTRNQLREAIKWYKSSVSMDLNILSSYRILGYIYKDLKNWGMCRKYLGIFLKKAPANHIDRSEVSFDLRACREAQFQ